MTTEERFEKLEVELAAAKRLTRQLMLMAGVGVVLGMFALFVAIRAMTVVAPPEKHKPGRPRKTR